MRRTGHPLAGGGRDAIPPPSMYPGQQCSGRNQVRVVKQKMTIWHASVDLLLGDKRTKAHRNKSSRGYTRTQARTHARPEKQVLLVRSQRKQGSRGSWTEVEERDRGGRETSGLAHQWVDCPLLRRIWKKTMPTTSRPSNQSAHQPYVLSVRIPAEGRVRWKCRANLRMARAGKVRIGTAEQCTTR